MALLVPDDDLLIIDDLSFLEIVQPRVDHELAEQLINFWRSSAFVLFVLLVIVWFYYRARIYLFYFGSNVASQPGFMSPKSKTQTPLMSPKTRTMKIET